MSTHLERLAAAKRARHGVWGCTCGADNLRHHDACHECQRPSWTCAACGTVNPSRSTCTECGGQTPAELLGDEGEPTYAEWCALQVGPRRVGGTYDHGYEGSAYTVLALDRGPRPLGHWPTWQITVCGDDGQERTHCTGWDPRRDRIVSQAPADVTIVSIGRLHDAVEGEYADILQHATIALDLRDAFADPHRVSSELRQQTAHDQAVRDTVMDTPGIRPLLAATALQIEAYLAGPTTAPITVVTQCAGGRHRAATTAMALRAVVSGDVEQAARYGLEGAAQQFTDRHLVVDLAHRDLDKDVVDR